MASADNGKKGGISFTFDLGAVVAAIVALAGGILLGTVGLRQREQVIPTPTTEVVPATKVSATSLAVSSTYLPQPTHTPYPPNPTYTPYPTFTPYLVVATPGPVIVTPTPSAEEQNPPAGSIIPAGQAYTKGDIAIRLLKKIGFYEGGLGFSFEIENAGTEQYIIRWKNSALHLRDDLGREYAQSSEEREIYNKVKAFTLNPGETVKLEAAGSYYDDSAYTFGYFQQTLSYDAKYLLITIDQIAGMSNLNWQYDLP